MSVVVHVTFADVLLSAPLITTIEGCTSCDSPIFEYLLRRRIHELKTIPPFQQIITKTESVKHSAHVTPVGYYTMLIRLRGNPDEHRLQGVQLHPLTVWGHGHDQYQIHVDLSDTVMDLKFLLAPLISAPPEHIQMNYNTLRRLGDDETVSSADLLSDEIVIMWWLEIPSERPQTESPVYRSVHTLLTSNPLFPDLGSTMRGVMDDHPETVTFGVRSFLDEHDFAQRGEYEFTTFADINRRITNIASGLRFELGLEPSQNTKIGMCSGNRPEWLMCDFACQVQSMVTVPLYPTLDKNAISFIVNHADVILVACSVDVLDEVYKAKQECPCLKYIVLMDDQLPEQVYAKAHPNNNSSNNNNNGDDASGGGGGGCKYDYLLSDLERIGAQSENLARYADKYAAHPDSDICTIMYTSGTTGDPKGVLVTHTNIMAALNGYLQRDMSEEQQLQPEDKVYLSYLPLAHSYERVVNACSLVQSTRVCFWSGDIEHILDDMQLVKPRLFFGVPRVFQKFQDRMLAGISEQNFLIRWVYQKLYDSKLDLMLRRKLDLVNKNQPGGYKCWFDRIFQPKFRAVFGGNVMFAGSGSAPLSKELTLFLKVALFDVVGEGYGLTETCTSGTGSSEFDLKYGHVGQPRANIEVKLVSVPDMAYNVTDKPYARGEIWLRGASIFKGYYRLDEKTRQVLTADHWFKTGDIGLWRSEGRLEIIDRKKNIFKLAQGEYIRPEYIQNVYKMSRYIDQIFVYGNSLQTYLVAIVVPDFEVLPTTGIAAEGIETSAEFQELVFADMQLQEAAGALQGFEKVRKIVVKSEQFTAENGLATISMKLKRASIRQKYRPELEQLYSIQSKL